MQMQVRPKVFKPIIPDKWGWAIWLLMFVASMLRNIVSFIWSFDGLTQPGEITYMVIEGVLIYGMLPTVICYVFSLVLFTMSVRRRAVFCRRNDFIYICMLFTAGAYVLMGVIECFAFLDVAVLPYTEMLLNMTVLTGAYCAMFFAVFAPKTDPRKKYVNFTSWASVYLGLQGLLVLVSSVSFIVLFYDDAVNDAVMELMEAYYGAAVTIDSGYATAGIIALCLLAAWVIAASVVAALLSRKAKGYVPPADDGPVFTVRMQPEKEQTPFEELNDAPSPRGGGSDDGGAPPSASSDDDKVFDEFDL